MLDEIVQQSNLYATQQDINKPLALTRNELQQFIGMCYYMSIFGLPATRMYWNKSCRVDCVANVMSVKRWEMIKHCLHFNDNTNQNDDKLYKIR